MVTKKSTQSAREASVKKSLAPQKGHQAQALRSALYGLADQELVKLPVLSMPHAKAPAVDPYLKPETVSTEIVSFGGVTLPPILSGTQPGIGLGGEPKDYRVRVIWASRRQIDAVLSGIERERPEMQTLMEVVRAFTRSLDSIRAEVGLHIASVQSSLRCEPPKIDQAMTSLDTIRKMIGHWDDENRLLLY